MTGGSRASAAADFLDCEVALRPVRDDVLGGREMLQDAVDHDRDLNRLRRPP